MSRLGALVAVCLVTLSTTAIARTTTTVTVVGRVVHAVTGDPVSGADVSLNVDVIDGAQRKAISGDDGRFFVDNVPAGRYYLFAIKAGYFYAGLNDEGQPGASDLLVIGWPAPPPLTLKLRPHGAIAGTVLDEASQPVVGATVRALVKKRVWPSWGRQWGWDRASNISDGVTNVNGQYVIEPLPAGEYLIQVDAERVGVPGAISKTYGTTYSPGSPRIEGAEPFRLGTGERRVTDVRVTAKPGFEISGVVLAPMSDANVYVQLLAFDDSDGAHSRSVGVRRAQGGSFIFAGVPAGDYALVVDHNDEFRTEQRIRIDDRNLSDVQLRLTPPIVISGTIVWEGVERPPERSTLIDRRSLMFGVRPEDQERLRASLPILLGTVLPIGRTRPVGDMRVAYSITWTSETTFTLRLPPGRYLADFRDQSGWLMKSLRINGKDATDEPVEITAGSTAVLTMTRSKGRVTGTAVLAPGTPTSFCVVALFSTNRHVWPSLDASARHVLVNSADENGRFEYADVLPGEYYLAALATLDLEGLDTDTLGRLAASAQKVQVSATAPLAVTLTCGR